MLSLSVPMPPYSLPNVFLTSHGKQTNKQLLLEKGELKNMKKQMHLCSEAFCSSGEISGVSQF